MDDYRGPFDPDFDLGRLSRRGLAGLGREYLQAGHLIDRSGIPQVLARYGQDAARDVAIVEWMGASPVYTRRLQRALHFEGDDVGTIFKGMQFDVGSPHQFLDFRFELDNPTSGVFWLASCGALLDAEPMGESFVRMMCHEIEDPTMDATALATNPRARMRPVHRPPRAADATGEHCRWTVTIEPDVEPVLETEHTRRVRASRAAGVRLPLPTLSGEQGGRDDYAGPFDPEFQFEDLSQAALVTALEEICLEGHLLVRSFLMAVADRWGHDAVGELARQQWTGVAGVAATRIGTELGLTMADGDDGGDAAEVAKMLQVHPAMRPLGYVGPTVALIDADGAEPHVRLSIAADAPVLAEGDPYSWFAELGPEPPEALGAIVTAVNPRARCRPASELPPGAALAWEAFIDPTAEPARPAREVELTRISTGADFVFVRPGTRTQPEAAVTSG